MAAVTIGHQLAAGHRAAGGTRGPALSLGCHQPRPPRAPWRQAFTAPCCGHHRMGTHVNVPSPRSVTPCNPGTAPAEPRLQYRHRHTQTGTDRHGTARHGCCGTRGKPGWEPAQDVVSLKQCGSQAHVRVGLLFSSSTLAGCRLLCAEATLLLPPVG